MTFLAQLSKLFKQTKLSKQVKQEKTMAQATYRQQPYKPSTIKLPVKMMSGALMVSLLVSGCASLPLPTRGQLATGNYGVVQTERTVAQRLMDESIARTAKININNFDAILNASRIDVDSFDNKVLLTGEVPDEASKKNAENIVASMAEVKEVYNQLKVGRPHTMSYHLHDVYITSKLRSKILTSPQLSSTQVSVVTETGIVYVMGRLTKSQQEQLVQLANSTPGVLELVLLTTVIDAE